MSIEVIIMTLTYVPTEQKYIAVIKLYIFSSIVFYQNVIVYNQKHVWWYVKTRKQVEQNMSFNTPTNHDWSLCGH